ncbi:MULTISPECIES: methylated-DNA--[protein]-cysteine S-methyltransferase [unclassified Acinetobacter]|uniref:methylated-DNA--[protein]-cysteine S-methyltransferase n=1 Tax=unclassified Acinetobacter TaxID=196816 RepID=UPI0035B7525E
MPNFIRLYQHNIDSPVGTIRILASEQHLYAILWQHESSGRALTDLIHTNQAQYGDAMLQDIPTPAKNILDSTQQQLLEYFQKQRQIFDIPMQFVGTDFQIQVWQQLQQIAYGETCSYMDIANRLNNPKAIRAVGVAIGKNPISIMVPCHRVIGKDGSLTGFAGGLDRKQYLLDVEKL